MKIFESVENTDLALPDLEEEDIHLTVEMLRDAVPKRAKPYVTQEFVDHMDAVISDPSIRETFRQGLLSYTSVLEEPNMSLKAYVQAVRYASYKMQGMTHLDAWMRTFPERYQRMLDDRKDLNHIRSIATQYSKGKAVVMVMQQSIIPVWLLNADVHQKAVNTLAELMSTAKSEKVRSDSASALLTHLKQPEIIQHDVNIRLEQDDSIQEMRQAALELVKAQKELLQAGISDAKEIAESKIIAGESERLN